MSKVTKAAGHWYALAESRGHELATLRAERDELKAALKDLLESATSEGTNYSAFDQARAVLAKTKAP